jgi:hypothetical protein
VLKDKRVKEKSRLFWIKKESSRRKLIKRKISGCDFEIAR